jgi:adenosylcobinamide-phosphate synthase
LYITMGFRQFSHYFTDIHQALRADKLDEARRLLSEWRNAPANELNAEEVARLSIEEALLASHRNVFGVIVWFVLFSVSGLGGAAGALLYRMGQFLRTHWSDQAAFGEFTGYARQAYDVLEWLPIRLTAITFAIVGDFEDTLYCWRSQAATWPDSEAGILLASGAGSLGVRLGMVIPQDGVPLDRPELGIGDDADADFMQSAIGLVWRSVVFWLILLLMLSLANLLG